MGNKNKSKITTSLQILEKDTLDIAKNVIEEKDTSKIKDLTALFNLNIQKKNMVRMLKLTDLLDDVSEKILERFEKRPDEITNKELIEFLNAIQNTIDKTHKSINQIEDTPVIQVNQQKNEINVNIENTLNRESKTKVMDFIEALLKADPIKDSTEETIEIADSEIIITNEKGEEN